jgi:hypothetical protein
MQATQTWERGCRERADIHRPSLYNPHFLLLSVLRCRIIPAGDRFGTTPIWFYPSHMMLEADSLSAPKKI